jgi:heat shock protein HslJ
LRHSAALAALLALAALPVAAGGDSIEGARGGAAAAASHAGAALEGTHWKLVEVAGAPAVAGREAYLELSAEGRKLAGTSGCNRLFGSYELGGDRLRFGGVGATRMACEEALMKQEQALEAALQATTSYRVDGSTLELRDGERVLARFAAGS